MRQYLYADQLAELTPWTAEAIRTMIARGEFVEGVHYFKHGPRSRPIFSWSAVVAYIENRVENLTDTDVKLANGTAVHVDEGTKASVRRLRP